MKAFQLRLSDEEHAELERRRAAGGFRSMNETVRAWLRPDDAMAVFNDALDAQRAAQRLAPGAITYVSMGPPKSKPGSRLKKGK